MKRPNFGLFAFHGRIMDIVKASRPIKGDYIMAAITRTFKSFELTAYELDDSIPPSIRPAAQYVVLDTAMNARKARIAFRDAGVALPKDCLIKWVEGEEKTYSMPVETFLENATVIDA
jgi:hypothetical protein